MVSKSLVLVDTNIWIDHLKKNNNHLLGLLRMDLVVMHPFVVGEMACGNFKDRTKQLSVLKEIMHLPVLQDKTVFDYIETKRLMGTGIGYIDAHLLATVSHYDVVKLWTNDNKLKANAKKHRVSYS